MRQTLKIGLRKKYRRSENRVKRGTRHMMSGEIENRFTYHPPKLTQLEIYERIRSKAKELAHLINDHCPESRETSTATTKLEEAVMWANASIARNT